MSGPDVVHAINGLGQTYRLDSDEFDSGEEPDDLPNEEYDRFVDEGEFISSTTSIRADIAAAENGYTEMEMQRFVHDLKERGLIAFLRDYLAPTTKGESASLRKLLLGFGILPVCRLPSTTIIAGSDTV